MKNMAGRQILPSSRQIFPAKVRLRLDASISDGQLLLASQRAVVIGCRDQGVRARARCKESKNEREEMIISHHQPAKEREKKNCAPDASLATELNWWQRQKQQPDCERTELVAAFNNNIRANNTNSMAAIAWRHISRECAMQKKEEKKKKDKEEKKEEDDDGDDESDRTRDLIWLIVTNLALALAACCHFREF